MLIHIYRIGGNLGNLIQSNHIKIDNIDIHYYKSGLGEPLLVIHGGSTGAKSWKGNLSRLSDNYCVYVPDLPGFGKSQPIPGDFYLPELVDFIDKFSDKLELKKFHLIGHSFGGAIALNYALKFPSKVAKLVLISSLCLSKDIALWVRVLSNCALCRILGSAATAVLKAVKWVASQIFREFEFVVPWTKFTMSLGCKITTLREQTNVLLSQLSDLTIPTLIVWGDKDKILPVKQAIAAAEVIPDCQLKVFKDSGHSVYREQIDEFSSVLRKFLG